jgi:hypothetical protein
MANLNGLKKYHFIYKTTNLTNDTFYIGMHSTNNLNDGYLGSGTRVRRSIRKYGKENFKIEYLEFFDSRELLVEREKQLVNEDLLKEPNCLNIAKGGLGGNTGNAFNTETSLIANRIQWTLQKRKLRSIEARQQSIEKVKNGTHSWLGKRDDGGMFKGKSHTEETKKKIGEANSKKQKGSKNSQFGTRWITNGTENKKIKKEEWIPTGWKAGRV